jgi:hypothetical protein
MEITMTLLAMWSTAPSIAAYSADVELLATISSLREFQLIGDPAWKDCEDGKSTEAYIFFHAGSPISWNSRKEEIVARSSTSAVLLAGIPADW